jgi:hypothetical protein
MNLRDVERVERELGRRLPDAYREMLLAFPFPAKAGNADFPLFDDADALIRRQRERRAGTGSPAQLFIGADGPENCYVLDLSRSPEEVLFVEDGDPGRAAPIGATIEEFVEALRGEVESRPGSAGPGPVPARPRRWAGVAFVLALLAVLFAATVLALLASGPNR